MSKTWHALVVTVLSIAVSGCTYEPQFTQLRCNLDDECADGAVCSGGFCVVQDEVEMPDVGVDVSEPTDDAVPAAIDRVVVEPVQADLVIGSQQQLTATVFDTNDEVVTDVTVAWASDDEAVATVSSSGVVEALSIGTVQITATVEDVVGIATITTLAPVDSVTIEPDPVPTLPRGQSTTLVARAFDAAGTELSDRTATWMSSDPDMVDVTEDGVATGILVGTATVTASVDDVSFSVDVTVEENGVDRVEIMPDDPIVVLGNMKTYDAVLYDDDDGVELDPRGRTFVWSVPNMAIVTFFNPPTDPDWRQRVTGTSEGTVTLTVDVDDGAATADLDLEVVRPTVDTVTILDPGIVPVGSTVQLDTLVEDPAGNALNGLDHLWSSSDDLIATVDAATGELTAISPGTVTITVDVDGVMAMRDIDVRFLLDQVDTGEEHSCGTSPDGVVLCWGSNNSGRLGIGMGGGTSATPTVIASTATFDEVQVGGALSCALESSGAIYCWGASGLTGVADGSATDSPREIDGGRTYTALDVGLDHACAIDSNGDVWCWGGGSEGRLGNNGTSDADAPVQVQFNPAGTPVSLALGSRHGCVLTDTPKIWCWGAGVDGALGNDARAEETTPVEVSSSENFEQISAGDQLTCARDDADAVYCWGRNSDGQLGIGDGSVDDATVPTLLPNVSMSSISVGFSHACGLDAASGEVQCWGRADDFRLGNADDQNDADAPVANAASLEAIALGSGLRHGCAVAADNRAYCWGSNNAGRSGTSSDDPIQMPTLVWPAQ